MDASVNPVISLALNKWCIYAKLYCWQATHEHVESAGPNSCARPPITPCSAWSRWPAPTKPSSSTPSPGHRPETVLRPDGQRERAQGVSRRPAGHRNRLAPGRHHPAPDLRHPGRGHGARLWRFHRL